MFRIPRGVLIVLCALGCNRATPDKAPTAEPESAATPLAELKRELALKLSAAETLVLNDGSYQEAIDKAKRQELGTGLVHAIPDQHDDKVFTDALVMSGARASVTISQVSMERQPNSPEEPPEEAAAAYLWKPEQLRDVYAVRFRIQALSAVSLARWYGTMRKLLPRLMILKKLTEIPGGWDAEAEIYAFRTARIPRHVPELPRVDALLEARGLARATLTGTKTKQLLADCDALAAKVAAKEAGMINALEPLARSHWYGARFGVFQDRIEVLEKVDLDALVGRPIPKPKHQNEKGGHPPKRKPAHRH